MLEPLFALTLIGALTLASQWSAWRLGAPSIVFLLAAGILVGPIGGLINADELLGELLFPVVSLSVAVILFEGSLTLRFEELKGTGSTLWRMLTIGVVATWVVISCASHWLIGLTWELAILFGAIMVVTGPTVIGPMLRAVRPNQRISKLLRWEGIVIDPVGAVLAIIIFDVIIMQESGALISGILSGIGKILVIGTIGGVAAGYVWGLVLRNYWLPEFLHNVSTLLAVLIVFVATDQLAHESGLLAVTIMGIWLANMRGVYVDDILDFKESLSVLLISALFILLASRLNLQALSSIGWPALGLLAIVQFIARPLKILVSTVPSELSWPERGLLSWIAPRGIVAAAISALFALKLEAINYPGAELIVPLAFAIIIGTVVWQGITSPLVAQKLNVAEPEANGVLFVGGNTVVRAIASKLQDAGFPVLVADSSWDNVASARMAGLPTYFGNPVSAHAERHLDTTGIGRLFAMSRRDDLNALACLRFTHEFSRNEVYALPRKKEAKVDEKHSPAVGHSGRQLFGAAVGHAKLASLLAGGASIRQTRLTEEFDYTNLTQQSNLIPLLAWNKDNLLMVAADDDSFKPGLGFSVLSIEPAESANTDSN